jgi:hypothetical protein
MGVVQFLRKAQSERINLVHRESRGQSAWTPGSHLRNVPVRFLELAAQLRSL